MKTTVLADFRNELDAYVSDVILEDDLVCVETPKGRIYVMSEGSYDIRHQALQLLFQKEV